MKMLENNLQTRFDNIKKSRVFNNVLNKFDLKNKIVLDIGCSNGEFLTHFGLGSIGITVNQDEVSNGKSMNLDIKLLNIEEVDLGAEFLGKFDIIFANNIFEHMLAPHLFLVKIKQYLKNDGLLILGVPTVPYIFPLIKLNKFSGSLSSAHVNFFNRYTLEKTVEYGGWNIIQNSGFYFKNRFLDYIFNYICPHFYAVAKINKDFKYEDKRLIELSGYSKTNLYKSL